MDKLENVENFLNHDTLDEFKPEEIYIGFDPLYPYFNDRTLACDDLSPLLSTSIFDSYEDSEIFSDINLKYIGQMLLEEDIEDKICSRDETVTLEETERPFYEVIGKEYPPPSDQLPLYTNVNGENSECSSNDNVSYMGEDSDAREFHSTQVPFKVSKGSLKNLENISLFENEFEEASNFLQDEGSLNFSTETSDSVQKKKSKEEINQHEDKLKEKRENLFNWSKGKRTVQRDGTDIEEVRSNKQSALYYEENIRSKMFDLVLLCNDRVNVTDDDTIDVCKSLKTSQSKSKSKSRAKNNGKKEVVDLRTLLIHCAQAVACDDLSTANELLKKIRHYASPFGDGSERLASYFADGLEARLSGTGSKIYSALSMKRNSATDILKAYHLFLLACPFKKLTHFFADQTILKLCENASKLHIIDFGISVYFGFQWPSLIQRLSLRPGGPPKLRITGIDLPQPGFRPSERVEETGRRLADYAQSFNVPFEYNGITSKWENVRIEHLNLNMDEIVIVNSLYRFRNLADETVLVNSPRDSVLNTIRTINPHAFIHGVVNGSYGAPFFLTRFTEALFHYSSLFDMLENNISREDKERILIEKEIFGREAFNVIACEGLERIERPETYKQWQVRNKRAGLVPLPLDQEILQKAKDKVQKCYHKDFIIDEDGPWMLQGWKGRIIYAISTWVANKRR